LLALLSFLMPTSKAPWCSPGGTTTNTASLVFPSIAAFPALVMTAVLLFENKKNRFRGTDAYGIGLELKIVAANFICSMLVSAASSNIIVANVFASWITVGITVGSLMRPIFVSYRGLHKEVTTEKLNEYQSIDEFPEVHSAFLEFLRSEFSAENLMFLDEVKRYKQLSQLSTSSLVYTDSLPLMNSDLETSLDQYPISLLSEGNSILQRFIQPNAPYEVNLSDAHRQELINAFTDFANPESVSPTVLESVFDHTFTDINYLLRTDPWPRFVSAQQAKQPVREGRGHQRSWRHAQPA